MNKNQKLDVETLISGIINLMTLDVITKTTAERIYALIQHPYGANYRKLLKLSTNDWEYAQGYHRKLEENLFNVKKAA
jgi:hypothetical protein